MTTTATKPLNAKRLPMPKPAATMPTKPGDRALRVILAYFAALLALGLAGVLLGLLM